ncbi:MAG: GNAT family N-acetyltransferase [Allosphingosinicella sp.]
MSAAPIREARPGDREALVALLHDSFRTTWRPQVRAEAWRRWLEEDKAAAYVDAMSAEFLVAEADGAVAAMAHWRGDFVHALHVHSRFRRRGLGSLLLRRAEADIAAAGHASARLETDSFNRTSRSFYAAHGYCEVSSRPDAEWDSGLTTLLLEKRL